MEHYKFIAYDREGKAKLFVKSNKVFLPSILEDFELFLKGAGFSFNGSLEIVYEEENND